MLDVHIVWYLQFVLCFFFNDTATTEIYTYLHTLSLHDALPISFSCVLWVLLIEIGRRTGGPSILCVTVVFSLFPVYAHLMPEVISGVNQTIWDTAAFHIMSIESFLGIPMRAFATLVFGFLIFGVAMQYTGAGAFFINFAFALLGKVRGGPAKVAIFSSGLFGSMSGSVVSNVLTPGCMTNPEHGRAPVREGV